ncbi:hypothetical protein KDA00_02065 [Candidatus Saccharibacteria bacterium]|nr:hypothetical protein [Candidatus Saccharibacteria bacterium]
MSKTKIKQLFSWPRLAALAALAFLVLLSGSSSIFAQAVTQGFGADTVLQKGVVVQLDKTDTTKVKPVTLESIEEMYGVVVDANDAPVTLSNEGRKVFVATVGPFDVLVSDQGGTINPGDYLTISAIEGVAMKAGDKEPVVVGRALDAYDGKTNVIGAAQVTDNNGASRTVNLSRIRTDISVSRNPLLRGETPNVPEFLRKASEAIAGKEVNAVRIYLSVFVFTVSTIAAGSLLYAGVRNGLISIGRNPLSKKTIIRGMFQVILTGLIIFIVGLFGVYLLLKL